MKKFNQILNVVMGAFAGTFIGCTIYVVWDFKTRPALYAMQSAPWYTGILMDGAVTIVVLMSCFAIKAGIKRLEKKSRKE